MRIDNGQGITAIFALRSASQKRAVGKDNSQDQAAFSNNSAELQLALDALRATPEMRDDEVTALQMQVEQGTFQVDEEAVADKLLGPRF